MDAIRNGKFTSSEIWKLTVPGRGQHGFGERALTYINTKRIERMLGRSAEVKKYARPMLWGKFIEARIHGLLPLSYVTHSDVTLVHPEFPYWVGSPDTTIPGQKVVGDYKAYEPLNFAAYTEALLAGDLAVLRKEFKEEWYQLISNACILDYDYIEAITYCPYKSELPDIRLMASNYDGIDQFRYRFIYEADDDELSHIPDNGYFKNLNVIRFKVPQEDKDFLTERVKLAEKILCPSPSTLIASYDHNLKATVIDKA